MREFKIKYHKCENFEELDCIRTYYQNKKFKWNGQYAYTNFLEYKKDVLNVYRYPCYLKADFFNKRMSIDINNSIEIVDVKTFIRQEKLNKINK